MYTYSFFFTYSGALSLGHITNTQLSFHPIKKHKGVKEGSSGEP